MAGANAFRNEFFSSDEVNAAVFESVPARMLRYEVGWAFYEGRQYSNFSFAPGFKVQEGLYKYISDLYNPTARLGDFYKGVIWGGNLDADAGNIGAIPVTVGERANEEMLRAAIAQGWQDSSWDTNKSAHVLHGTTLGDAAIYIRDDLEHGQARMEILHPSLIKHAEMDARGFMKRYVIEEARKDNDGRVATYREICEHGEGEDIIFKTFRNGTPYAWDDNVDKGGNARAEWTEIYGFVPLVLTQHINEARAWGRAEIHPFIKKIVAIEDQASILNDRIRIAIDPPLYTNFGKGDSEITFSTGAATTTTPKPGREQQKLIYVKKDNAAITPIVVPLDIAGVSANIKQLLDSLERDLPELRDDIMSNVAEGTLLAARSRVESKVIERRTNYNRGIVRANQMLIAIGGFRGYDGYDGFDLDSFKAGKLDHSVSPRPVFPETEEARINNKIKKWTLAADMVQKTQGQISAESVLLDLGMTQDELIEFEKQKIAALKMVNADEPPIDPITGEPIAQ